MNLNQECSENQLKNLIIRFEKLIDRLEKSSDSENIGKEQMYKEALQDAVLTLQTTKNSFRSKQLKDLRERLETILNE